MRAIIFSNGEIRNQKLILDMIHTKDYLIAVDGGATHCGNLDLTPSTIIGDLDSLDNQLISDFKDRGAEVIQYPIRKDETDLELALLYTVDKGFDEIIIFGVFGARWDMTLANVLLLTHPQLSNLKIRLSDGLQNMWLARDGETIEIIGKPGDTVSLIPLLGDVSGITTTNLEYPLNDSTLHFSSTRGISNSLIASRASVRITKGKLLVVVQHNQLPT